MTVLEFFFGWAFLIFVVIALMNIFLKWED